MTLTVLLLKSIAGVAFALGSLTGAYFIGVLAVAALRHLALWIKYHLILHNMRHGKWW
jgi:hypothetical protein